MRLRTASRIEWVTGAGADRERIGTPSSPSTWIPARANGAAPISTAASSRFSASAWRTGSSSSWPSATAATSPGAINLIGDTAALRPQLGLHRGATPSCISRSATTRRSTSRSHRGLERVEAGAQGEHKLARGYRPVITTSAHDIADPALRRAIAAYLERGARLRRARPPRSSSSATPFRHEEEGLKDRAADDRPQRPDAIVLSPLMIAAGDVPRAFRPMSTRQIAAEHDHRHQDPGQSSSNQIRRRRRSQRCSRQVFFDRGA